MKCFYHPDIESANACTVCSKLLCVSCSHSVKGKIYCQDCLIQGAELAALARRPQFANYSPSRAALFGLIPGIGAVYNRQYSKAVAHVGIFAALWIVADAGPGVFALATIAFWIFTIIDAYRSAEEILRRGITRPETLERHEDEEIKLPIWGSALVLLGALFFLSNLGALSLRSIISFGWPLLFVGAGFYLILSYYLSPKPKPGGSRNSGPGTEIPGGTPPAPPDFENRHTDPLDTDDLELRGRGN